MRYQKEEFKKWTTTMENELKNEKEEVPYSLTCAQDVAKSRDDNVAKTNVSINT